MCRSLLATCSQIRSITAVLLVSLLADLPTLNQLCSDSMLAYFIPTNCRQHIFKRLHLVFVCQPVLHLFSQHFDAPYPQVFELPVQAFTSNLDINATLIGFEVAANLASRIGCASKFQPVAGRVSSAAGHYVHNLPAL